MAAAIGNFPCYTSGFSLIIRHFCNMRLCFGSVLLLFWGTLTLSQAYAQHNNLPLAAGKKLDSLLETAYFEAGSKKQAKAALQALQEAKKLAHQYNYPAGLARALTLEGAALTELGYIDEAIDTLLYADSLYHVLADTKGQSQALFSLGDAYTNKLAYAEALRYFHQARQLCQQLDTCQHEGALLNNLANAYYHIGNYDEALQYYLAALDIHQQNNNTASIARAYANIALIYKSIGNYRKSLEYTHKAIALQKKLQQNFYLSISYLNAGNAYRQLNMPDSALYYHKAALAISNHLQDSVGIGIAYMSIANVKYNQEDWSGAIESYQQALGIFRQLGIVAYQTQVLSNMATAWLQAEDYDQAEATALQAEKMLDAVEVKSTHQSLAETLYNIYKQKKQFDKALLYHEKFKAYSDSLLNRVKVQEIARLETNHKIQEQDQEIVLLNKNRELQELALSKAQSTRLVLTLVLAIIVLLAIGLVYRYRLKVRTEKALAVSNQQLQELNTAKDKFFAIVAHDLRNPVSAFATLTTALHENYQNLKPKEIQHYLENLHKTAQQLTNLLHNLLQWALSQTRKLTQNPVVFDVNSLIDNNIKLIEESARQKNIIIQRETPQTAILAFADPKMIDLAIRNILSNAIKFTPEGGRITISAEHVGEQAAIGISDNGIGMSPKEIRKLFDFSQNPPSTAHSAAGKSTGLGLILSKEFIEKNNGRLKISSEPGKGSIFIILLPVNESYKRNESPHYTLYY